MAGPEQDRAETQRDETPARDPAPARLPPLEERRWQYVDWDLSDGGVLSITMARPEHLNALTFPLLREVQALIRDAAARPEIRVVALRGQGTRSFSSGDDLKGMDAEPGVDNAHTVHHQLVMAIRALPKPVVALMYGYALGAGFELALACDFRLAAGNLEIGDHRVQRAIGLIAGASWFLPRIVGQGRALDLLMTGRHLDAQEALEWGLVNRVWPVAEFESGAAQYLETLAQLPTMTVATHKAAVEYAVTHGLRDSLAHEVAVSAPNRLTEDAAEGRSSFLEKRDPVFRGR